jgi:hypothetical protein
MSTIIECAKNKEIINRDKFVEGGDAGKKVKKVDR